MGRESVWTGEDVDWRGCGKAGSEEGSFEDVRKKLWEGSGFGNGWRRKQ